MALAPVTLVYDGECKFCIRSLRILKALDWRDRLVLVPVQDTERVKSLGSILADADFATAMYAVRGGKKYRGFDAFRAALPSLPAGLLVVWIWYLPGVRWLGVRLYDWVARHRRSFGCSSSCQI